MEKGQKVPNLFRLQGELIKVELWQGKKPMGQILKVIPDGENLHITVKVWQDTLDKVSILTAGMHVYLSGKIKPWYPEPDHKGIIELIATDVRVLN